ncbi:MAG: photosynthetic reaction center subunit H [Pseudomonadota bacterium]
MFTDLFFVSGIDLVDITLWAFTIFFFGLVFVLNRESHREGFPLETEQGGTVEDMNSLRVPLPKTYKLPHGRGEVSFPNMKRESRTLALAATSSTPGSPFVPTGDPLKDGVGPASWSERQDVPDLTLDGDHRIVPYRVASGYTVEENDIDPRGLPVIAGDGKKVGTVSDLWVDRSEAIIRYYEVTLDGGEIPKRVLVPFAFSVVKKDALRVEAIYAEHFDGVPTTKTPDSVTRLEEDKISGYFGGGKLYASKDRQEPWI